MKLKSLLLLAGIPVVCGFGFLAWQHYWPVQAAAGWSTRLVYDNVEKAAGLGFDGANVLVTQELRNDAGSLISIAPDGTRTTLVANLSKPDGLAPFMGGHAFSQEWENKPVQLLKDGKVTPLFMGTDVQGLKPDGNRLYAIEDRHDHGRLMRYDATDGSLTVLRDNLSESESVEICPGRKLLYTAKKQGVVRQFDESGQDPVYVDGITKPTFILCDKRGLWIVEDQTHLARLWLRTPDGKLQVILSHLRAPQELLPTGDNTYLLAEGGRNRVIELKAVP
ncbi:hypothetical protein [Pseudomonas sp. TE3610]